MENDGRKFEGSLKEALFGNPILDKIKRKSQEKVENSNDLLEEFSEQENEFYVDEVKKKSQKKPIEKRSNIGKRHTLTPTKRRIKTVLSFIIILGIILALCIVLSLTVLFKTQVFEVTGNTKYTEEEIVQASGLSKGENIFLAPKSLAAKRIINQYPYVEKVDIGIRVPDTITINVTEAVESYLVWVSETEYLVVSSEGRILNKVESPQSVKLPIFIGPGVVSTEIGKYVEYEDEKVLNIINEISTVFSENGYEGITEINASDSAKLTFTYDNRILVKLGLPENLDYKIRTAMTIIEEKIDINGSKTAVGELDVSNSFITKKSYYNEIVQISTDETQGEEGDETRGNRQNETISANLNFDNLLDGLDNGEGSTNNENEPQEEETKKKIPQEEWYVNG